MSKLFRGSLPWNQRIQAGLAIWVGRFLKGSLRLLGRAGTALPGKAALKIMPGLLSALVEQRMVYLVTGTNGKTTTVRMLCTLLQEQGKKLITNPSGANLDSGLTSTLLDHIGQLKTDRDTVLVFEIDEAFFAKLAGQLKPTVCVVTNFFRDQLDRYGELSHTRDLIAKGLADTQARVILCADDSMAASLARGREDSCLYFGLAEQAMQEQIVGGVQESAYCTFCGGRYIYAGHAYGHLGLFHCPTCGFSHPRPQLTFMPVTGGNSSENPPDQQTLTFSWQAQTAQVTLAVPGLHNGYNAAAALLAALASDGRFRSLVSALSLTSAAFGRMERFTVGDRQACLILVKNPVGLDRALEYIHHVNDLGAAMFLLNANDPDGRDVSWIWDVAFEQHLPAGPVGISGIRRDDMALRLYYAGKTAAELLVDADAPALFDRLLKSCLPGQCLYVLPNYTAMLSLRAELARLYQLRDFWQR